MSVKENYHVKGCDSTSGLVFYAERPVSEHAPLIEAMVELGAVPFCQTNVPQALFTMQTSNPLYGATGNPWDKERECGGSSGGEGSIIGAGTS